MAEPVWASSNAAWYSASRMQFLATPTKQIAYELAGRAADESLEIEREQAQEWTRSVNLLQVNLEAKIPLLRRALEEPGCDAIHDVILEFDFRRRGLRMDCLLLAEGALFVIEFKRSRIGRADRDQVMNYAVNLIEFHRVTREWCDDRGAILVPVLALTEGKAHRPVTWPDLAGHSWPSIARKPLECDGDTLRDALLVGLANRRAYEPIPSELWLQSPFQPSSSILDATLSLYGNHDVVAIQDHAAPKAAIEASTIEIQDHIHAALAEGAYHVVFLSGAPGAGKTLVGLELVMRGSHAAEAVFVTGNAPLVEVLNKALMTSYRSQAQRADSWSLTGYRRKDEGFVAGAATYKIVKAHNFLGKRGQAHGQQDGRVLVFDEAQRTYEQGRIVLGQKLADHEADLILAVQRQSYPEGGAVVVALIGHNQAINRGERGIRAWLEAADRHGWTFSIGDETLALAEFQDRDHWAAHPGRRPLEHGHLRQSMRYYRNAAVEDWGSQVLEGRSSTAHALAQEMDGHGNSVWLTRDLGEARTWAREISVGGQRCGIIASGQAKRLAAEGLFVDFKPDIATWMLAPSSDVRSSNSLETVQNQYQIQGLELDYCIVCWDADLRIERGRWAAYKLSGSDWQKDGLLPVAKNGYRVILTRARKGMVIFVPTGDCSGEDATRDRAFYDRIFEFLVACGAKPLVPGKDVGDARTPDKNWSVPPVDVV